MLLEHPSVIDCAVFGVEDPLLGERVTAILVLDSDNEVCLWGCGLVSGAIELVQCDIVCLEGVLFTNVCVIGYM